MVEQQTKKPRWGRRIILIVVLIVGLLMTAVALAPTLVSAGVGKSSIVGVINENINGTADYARLNVSWFGSQSIENLTIIDTSGTKVVDISARAETSLISLLSGLDRLAVSIKGSINATLEEDGSTNLTDLAATPGGPPAAKQQSTSSDALLPGGMAVVLDVQGLNVSVEVADGPKVEINDLQGKAAIEPGNAITADFTAGTLYREQPGQFKLSARSKGAIDRQGRLNLSGASLTVDVSLQNVKAPAGPVSVDVKSLTIGVQSNDVTQDIDLSILGSGMIDGSEPSTIDGAIKASKLLKSDGSVDFDIGKMTGTLQARALPTAVAQPFLKDTSLILSRDLGPTIDIDANFGSGEEKVVTLKASAQQLTAEMAAEINAATRAVEGSKLAISANVQPETLRAIAGIGAESPTTVQVNCSGFTVPPMNSDGSLEISKAGGTVQITIPGRTQLLNEDGKPLAELGDVSIDIDAPTLAQTIVVKASAGLEGGHVKIDQSVANLFNDGGLVAEGQIELSGVSGDRLGRFLPDQEELIAQLVSQPLEFRATTGLAPNGDLNAAINADTGRLKLSLNATRHEQQIKLTDAKASAELVPELVATLQTEESIKLGHAATVTVQIPEWSVLESKLREGNLTGSPIQLSYQSTPIQIVKAPGVASPVTIEGLAGDLNLALDDKTNVKTTGAARVLDNSGTAATELKYDASAIRTASSAEMTIDALVTANDINLAAIESILGRAAGELQNLLGSTGKLTLGVSTPKPSAYAANATVEFPQMKGEILAKADDREITATTKDLVLILPPDAANRWLAPADGSKGWTTTSTVTVRPQIAALSVPRAIASGESLDSSKINVDASIDVEPLTLVSADQLNIGVQRLQASAKCSDLSKGVDLSLNLAASSPDIEARDVRLSGKLTDLVGPDSNFAIGSATADLKGSGAVTLRKSALEKLLNPSPSSGPVDPASRVAVDSDLTLTPDIRSLRLPFSLASSETVEASKVNVNLGLTGSPLQLNYADGSSLGVRDLAMNISCPDLRQGVDFSLTSNATASGASAGMIEIRGGLRELVTADSKWSQSATLDLDGKVQNVPTALADQAQNLNGLLIAALGPTMNATAKAQALSKTGGMLAMDFRSQNGFVAAPVISAHDDALWIEGEHAITGELAVTKPLREQLLYKINPILADIRQTDHPIKLLVRNASVPLDGNPGRFNGQIVIDVGPVQFDAGSTTLQLLELFKQSNKSTIDGLIDPLTINIASGHVTYDNFAVHIGKKSGGNWAADLKFAGDINLASKPAHVNFIRTRIPADIATKSIKEVPDIVGLLALDLELHGDLADAAGNRKELERRIKPALDTKDPAKILDDPKVKDVLGDIFKKITK